MQFPTTAWSRQSAHFSVCSASAVYRDASGCVGNSGFVQSSECAEAESCADVTGIACSLSGGDMKRTAATLMLLAGLGSGGCMTPAMQTNKANNAQQTTETGGYGTVTYGKKVNGVQGAYGEPVMAVRNR